MNVFELLGIELGEAILVDHPFVGSSGPRYVIPLSLSKNGISIRAIDTRYGNIRYVNRDWYIIDKNGCCLTLSEIPYIKQKIYEWENNISTKLKYKPKNLDSERVDFCLDDIKREIASVDEVLATINLSGLKVVITGKLPVARAEFKALLESKGAIVTDNVSGQTSYLLMGDTGKFEITRKMKQAHDLGVKIISL